MAKAEWPRKINKNSNLNSWVLETFKSSANDSEWGQVTRKITSEHTYDDNIKMWLFQKLDQVDKLKDVIKSAAMRTRYWNDFSKKGISSHLKITLAQKTKLLFLNCLLT